MTDNDLRSILEHVAAELGRGRSFSSILADLERRDVLASRPPPAHEGAARPGPVFGDLQLLRTFRSRGNGRVVRVWRVLEDHPECVLSREEWSGSRGPGAGEFHLRAGDELHEHRDRLTPLEVRRDRVEIATPERWLLRHLWGPAGPPPWGQERYASGTATETPAGAAGIWEERSGTSVEWSNGHSLPCSRLDRDGCVFPADGRAWILEVRRGLKSVGAPQGSCLVYAWLPAGRPAHIYGSCRAISVEELGALRQELTERGRPHDCRQGVEVHLEPLRVRDIAGSGRSWSESVCRFMDDARQWGRRLDEWYPRLFVVRPFAADRTVRPIDAGSDAAAIVELLSEVAEDTWS